MGEREEPGDDPRQDEQADVGAADGDEQRRHDRERQGQPVQEGALGGEEPEEHVHELHVQVALDVAVPGERRQRPEQVVGMLDGRRGRDPAEAAAQQEQDDGQGRRAGVAREPAGEGVQPDGDEHAEDVAVERERAAGCPSRG